MALGVPGFSGESSSPNRVFWQPCRLTGRMGMCASFTGVLTEWLLIAANKAWHRQAFVERMLFSCSGLPAPAASATSVHLDGRQGFSPEAWVEVSAPHGSNEGGMT
jgi:hypothetical protein